MIAAHGLEGRIFYWHVASPLMIILVAFDWSTNGLSSSGVVCVNQCLEEVDLRLSWSGWYGCALWWVVWDAKRFFGAWRCIWHSLGSIPENFDRSMDDLTSYGVECSNQDWETVDLRSGNGCAWEDYRSCWPRMAARLCSKWTMVESSTRCSIDLYDWYFKNMKSVMRSL
jgi:hypothetical protein